jgi:hypothetical protein
MTAQAPIITFPTPAFQNLPITAQFYQPNVFVISAIAFGTFTTITTTTDMNYVIGQQIRLNIPGNYGCYELNGQTGFVTSIPALNQVEVNINSQNASPFVMTPLPNNSQNALPQIAAIGGVNLGYTSSTGPNIPLVTIPGSFINIS